MILAIPETAAVRMFPDADAAAGVILGLLEVAAGQVVPGLPEATAGAVVLDLPP